MLYRAFRSPDIMPTSTSDLRSRWLKAAHDEGFAIARITTPQSIPEMPDRLQSFLGAGFHGEMAWLDDRKEWRANPAALWPEANSILMLADSYGPKPHALDNLADPDIANVSVYARSKDYHDIVKKRLKKLARWLISEAGGEVKVFVDTAPVAEKPLAQAAGLGWQGKHTNLVSREAGNWFFLGAIFTTIDFDVDQGEIDHCGSCRKCLDVCPTNAFPAPYKLDARKCISYLTIELKGPIEPDLRPLLGNRIYGCDDCLAVCPWNKFAQSAGDLRYAEKEDLLAPPIAEFLELDDAKFRARFPGSPVKRIGIDRFLRNVLYAAGNSGNAQYLSRVSNLKSHENPVVSDAATWAEQQIIRAQET